MRVSDNTNFGVVRDSLNRSRARLEKLQLHNSTLKSLNKPSDDPVGAGKILEMRTEKVNNDQFQANAKYAQAFLENTDAALDDIGEVIMRAKEIAIGQASSASSTNETRLGVAEEINQLYQRVVAVSNKRIGDRFIFGGFQNTSQPFDTEGNYKGDDGELMLEIGREVFIGMNIPGFQVFNTNPDSSVDKVILENNKNKLNQDPQNEPSRQLASEKMTDSETKEIPNINLFDELKTLRVGLLTGDQNSIRSTLERFDDLMAKVISVRSKIGSRIQGIQGNITTLERHNVSNAQLSSGIEDADLTQIVSDMAKEESIFKSSLASSKHLIQPTLLDFLR